MSEQTNPYPFIDRDEYIMLMDWPAGLMSLDDLKVLHDAGVRTVYGYLHWSVVEPRPGVYRWEIPDSLVNRMLAADMKLVLMVTEHITWAPDDWYVRQPDGRIWRNYYDGYRDGWPYSILSPWNERAMAYQRDWERKVCARYNCPRVECVAGQPHGGETLLPGMAECWFDDAALASYRRYVRHHYDDYLTLYNMDTHSDCRDWDEVRPAQFPNRAAMAQAPLTVSWLHDSLIERVMEQQAIFSATPAHEAWYMLPQRDGEFAEQFESGPRSCNWLAEELYRITPERLGAYTNILLYEVFRPRGTQNILSHVRGYKGQTWVGSQYIEGLKTNTARAIGLGLRGFLTGPVHPDSGNRKFDPAWAETVAWSIGEWRAARKQASEPRAQAPDAGRSGGEAL